jgi:hypothetical protein
MRLTCSLKWDLRVFDAKRENDMLNELNYTNVFSRRPLFLGAGLVVLWVVTPVLA